MTPGKHSRACEPCVAVRASASSPIVKGGDITSIDGPRLAAVALEASFWACVKLTR